MRKKRVPAIIIAVRKGNREAEKLLHGDGFHPRVRIARNKKAYSRKLKHRALDSVT